MFTLCQGLFTKSYCSNPQGWSAYLRGRSVSNRNSKNASPARATPSSLSACSPLYAYFLRAMRHGTMFDQAKSTKFNISIPFQIISPHINCKTLWPFNKLGIRILQVPDSSCRIHIARCLVRAFIQIKRLLCHDPFGSLVYIITPLTFS